MEFECPDCNRICSFGTLSKDCTKCTCEHHVVTGKITDENGNVIINAVIYKLGHYDALGKTKNDGTFR